MAPPELARDAPVADVVHPLVVGLDPVGGDELDAAVFDGCDGLFGERLGLDEPLLGNQRLDHGLAAIAFAEAELVGLDLDEQRRAFPDPPPRACGLRSGRGRRRGRRRRSSSPSSSITWIFGRLWRLPASKSLGSCAGVIFTTPVPNSGSAMSSRMIGISRSISGSCTVRPCRSR